MNESAKEQFKWKFWHLAVILNGVIFFSALCILFLLLDFLPYRFPVAGVSLVVAGILGLIFRKQYSLTKAWLDTHG